MRSSALFALRINEVIEQRYAALHESAFGRFCCRSLRLKELGRLKRFLEAAGLRLLGWSGGFDAVAPIPTTTMRRTRRLLVVAELRAWRADEGFERRLPS